MAARLRDKSLGTLQGPSRNVLGVPRVVKKSVHLCQHRCVWRPGPSSDPLGPLPGFAKTIQRPPRDPQGPAKKSPRTFQGFPNWSMHMGYARSASWTTYEQICLAYVFGHECVNNQHRCRWSKVGAASICCRFVVGWARRDPSCSWCSSDCSWPSRCAFFSSSLPSSIFILILMARLGPALVMPKHRELKIEELTNWALLLGSDTLLGFRPGGFYYFFWFICSCDTCASSSCG